jgi:hypothetical protein
VTTDFAFAGATVDQYLSGTKAGEKPVDCSPEMMQFNRLTAVQRSLAEGGRFNSWGEGGRIFADTLFYE